MYRRWYPGRYSRQHLEHRRLLDQTFTGTGLTSIDALTINLSLFDNLANLQQESISITVNGSSVGSFDEVGNGTTQNPLHLSQTYNTFGTISGIGAGDTAYDITFTVEAPGVPGGDGARALSFCVALDRFGGDDHSLPRQEAQPKRSPTIKSLLKTFVQRGAKVGTAATRKKSNAHRRVW